MVCLVSKNTHRELWHSVTWQPGWVTLLHGPNGAGKTTWLKHLASKWAPVYYSGHNLGWIPHLTVQENIKIWGMAYARISSPLRAMLVARQPKEKHGSPPPREDNNSKETNIPFAYQQWEDLSQGQKQYVAFWGAQASRCTVWLMDEPFAHMDADHTQQAKAMCCEHLENGGALVMTSHLSIVDFWPHVQEGEVKPYKAAC